MKKYVEFLGSGCLSKVPRGVFGGIVEMLITIVFGNEFQTALLFMDSDVTPHNIQHFTYHH